MNSEEGVSLAKMAVTVLLVVLVITAVVSIVYAAYDWFSSGADKLNDQVVSIDKTSLSQFDDQQVSGTDVISAMKEHRESDIAIVVANKDNLGTEGFELTTVPEKAYNYCAVIENAVKNADTGAYTVELLYNANEGRFETKDGGLKWEDDNISLTRNTNFSPTTTKGKAEQFVKKSATWYSNLIYDSTTGDVCGILFRQMN